MLPDLEGTVHLSVEGGCGGTTFALQHARQVLSTGSHVIWVCNEIPDGNRFSQLYSNVAPSAVSRMHLIAIGDNLEQGIRSATGLLDVLNNIALVVVDDWTAKVGRVTTNSKNLISNLSESCKISATPLLIVSSAYEDANSGGWKARGNLEDFDVYFLHRSNVNSMIRELHIAGDVQEYILEDEGFTRRK
ncbi:MAG: hypothetical protein QF454_04805 [Candidatus Thalassarchaeaceae archaeon]|jgi:hypothetical protein|nr:hypothetical protein [Candidatus Thalassarchaeaceae archaeon]